MSGWNGPGRPMDHRELRESVGLYVLGRLPENEAAAVQAHLDGCEPCREEYRSLQHVPGLLDLVDPERLDVEVAPPPGLGDAVMSRIQLERRREARPSRRSRPIVLVAASIVIALVLGAGIGWVVKPEPAAPPLVAVAVQHRADLAVDGEAHLIDHGWGIEVVLSVTGLPAGERYRVDIVDRSGGRTSAGGMIGTTGRVSECRLTAAVPMGETVSFELLDDQGRRVLWSSWG